MMDNGQHQYWAKLFLKALVKRVKHFDGGDKFITYGTLAKEVSYPEPHTGNLFGSNIGHTLGVLGHLIEDIVVEGQKPPLIQAMVVNSGTKLPSDGLKEFDRTYPSLSTQKKRDFASAEYRNIFRFGERWDEVLKRLKVDINDDKGATPSRKERLYNPYGSEGSPEHRALRDYIANNPAVIDLGIHEKGITEYPLKSGDSVDVVFSTSTKIVAVEVKSERSGNDDIERGIFQCVKYSAVIAAEKIVNKEEHSVDAILVLAGKLSKINRKKARDLGLTVYEDVEYA